MGDKADKDARRRRYAPKACTSLLALLQAVQGRKLIFELRNDTIITGKLASVDDNMNAFIEDATWQPVQGPSKLYPVLFIKGRTLRFVHLPRQLDPIAAVDAYIETLKKQRRQAVMELLNKRHGRMDKGDPQGGQNSSKEGPSGDGSSGGAAAAPG